MKSVDLIVILLCFIQMFVAILITRKNKNIFDNFPAHQYFEAFLLLKKENPIEAYILCFMYGLIPVEFFVVFVFFS